ncbi:prepilin peptidase-dependent protein [uncultured Cedecea sp.]|uniref:prepilin peptidase-dependent protein n=1 Tax=uncultured Cedecea sp. TaxID=988762 RepID=UPI00262465F0|nr:prepilin peptidase-dependent protein [uncultured Cedecea sp.]
MNKMIQGFSLIEMMVVMVMIAILSSGAIYGFQQWQHHQRLWQTAHQLSQFLRHLRSDANGLNRDHILTLWQQGDRWCLTTEQYADKPCITTSPRQFIPRFKDVLITEMTPGLGFYGVMNTAKPGHIILSNTAGRRKIILSVWGRIRILALAEQT